MGTTVLGIDIGSTKICAIIAQKDEDEVKILGTGISKSNGLKKGVITNIELASKAIKNAVNDAKRVAGTHFEKSIVSVSGAYVKSINSSGVVNIPSREIGIREIDRAIRLADHNGEIPSEYEKLHILPYGFRVDDRDHIEDPMGMNGTRLEVRTHIITVERSALNNLRKAVKAAGVNINNVVLNGYASSIAVLSEDDKNLGVGLIEMGGATCNITIHSEKSIIFNTFLAVGSDNVTKDLSYALHTPLNDAESVKVNYGSLIYDSTELIEVPKIGEENKSKEVSLTVISDVIYARVEETLMMLAKLIDNSGLRQEISTGIILTGGFTKMEGIKELASQIFDNIPVRIGKPRNIEGLFETLREPEYATAIGLILYGCGEFIPYEIDSNKELRYKNSSIQSGTRELQTVFEGLDDNSNKKQEEKMSDLAISQKLTELEDDKPKNIRGHINKYWNMVTQLF